MTSAQIKELVVPRIFECVGDEITNKRNSIGSSFTLKKVKPITAKFLENLKLNKPAATKFLKESTEQAVVGIRSSYTAKAIQRLIEQALESNNQEIIDSAVVEVGNIIIRHFKR